MVVEAARTVEALPEEGAQAEVAVPQAMGLLGVDVVSISSDESPERVVPQRTATELVGKAKSSLTNVAGPSHSEGPRALTTSGLSPFEWGGPRIVWSRGELGAPPIFVLDDALEGGDLGRLEAYRGAMRERLVSTLEILDQDIPAQGAMSMIFLCLSCFSRLLCS